MVPERFELGTLPYELLAGVRAAVEFAEGLGMDAVEAHERALLARLLDGLASLDRLTVHGKPGPAYADAAAHRRRTLAGRAQRAARSARRGRAR